ncbi:hypothetical protein M378DRAFT_170407 [Amanita muscaria Koide BX008]|uniref:Uncharacterized protein n=1 Tax=Amanita muscaria (strain Koide BX008) TaxID=946122 RepID=A0A0C2S773_AMAMK|nr:hypothetical protein M378DRAFT_170407 [Amanita muscaria Koide BX008]
MVRQYEEELNLIVNTGNVVRQTWTAGEVHSVQHVLMELCCGEMREGHDGDDASWRSRHYGMKK